MRRSLNTANPQIAGSRAYGYAGVAILGWSTAATAFKVGLNHLDGPHLLWVSSWVASLVLLLVVLYQRRMDQVRSQTWQQVRLSALQGSLNPCGYYLVLFGAYDRLPAQAAMALNYTWPLALALLAVPLLGEKLRPKTLLALGISLMGVILMAADGQSEGLPIKDPLGVVLALGSVTLWAGYWLLNVRDPRPAELKLLMSFGFGSLWITLVLPLLTTPTWPSWTGWAAGSYIGLMEMGLAFIFWLRGLELAPHRGVLSNWVYLAPFGSLIWIRLILGETIALTSVVGLLLILGSILWQSQPNPPQP